ncbi:TPA: leucine-rich repeat domain-containing protein, partial [Escherichia coli]
MKSPSIFNKIKPQSIQQHPEKNQLNWMLELNKWKEERILTGEIHRPECRNEAAERISCAFLSKQNDIDLSGLNLTTQPPGLQNFTSINLDNNQLTHFDATNYDRLVKLSLNSNALESINFPQGRNVSITHISMNNNCLRNIDIDRLSSITYFSAAHNQLEFVQLESCEWLQYLNLSHNQLTDIIAGNKEELLLLDLSHNKLTSLHNALFPNLNTLLINNNLLSEIKMFYSNFCNIQTLNAANNQLEN